MLNATLKQCREVGCTDRSGSYNVLAPFLFPNVRVLCDAEDELINTTTAELLLEMQLRSKSL